jgi:hypothetical protein
VSLGAGATHFHTPRPRCLSPTSAFPWRGIQGADATPASLTSCRGHRGRDGGLTSGAARRRPRRTGPFHSNPRGRAPRPGARPVHARARSAGSARARRGCGACEGTRAHAGERRGLRLLLLRKRQPPGAGPWRRPSLPHASRLKEDQASSQDAPREGGRRGAVPTWQSH